MGNASALQRIDARGSRVVVVDRGQLVSYRDRDIIDIDIDIDASGNSTPKMDFEAWIDVEAKDGVA